MEWKEDFGIKGEFGRLHFEGNAEYSETVQKFEDNGNE